MPDKEPIGALMRGPRAFLLVVTALSASPLLSGSIGCSEKAGDPPEAAPVCLDAGVGAECTPSYEPTWDALYTNTFQRSCAAAGVSCHAAKGHQGGVDFSESERAYSSLVKSKLVPGRPECSILVHRVIATDGKVRMPPGRSLSAGEQCAIIQWVAAGAKR